MDKLQTSLAAMEDESVSEFAGYIGGLWGRMDLISTVEKAESALRGEADKKTGSFASAHGPVGPLA
jgi:hypothetical protein